jgi:hypothetical protein
LAAEIDALDEFIEAEVQRRLDEQALAEDDHAEQEGAPE